MQLLANTSIRKRLTLIIMGISCISVLMTTLAISVIGINERKYSLRNELALLATVVGGSNKAYIQFGEDYKEEARKNLAVLSVRPALAQACLYAFDDFTGTNLSEFASYHNPKYDTKCPENIQDYTVKDKDSIQFLQEIKGDYGVQGYIYLESTFDEINQYIEEQTKIAFTVTLGAFLISYLLAINLQKAISKPILSLSSVARQISENKDYSVRAPVIGNPNKQRRNELTILTESFNEMLSEIGARDTQLKDQNKELERARDVAESANRAKSQFLANISHELRTPLNAIIGFSSILMNQLFGALGDEKYLEYSKDINESGTHLLDIINDILDLSKAEAGKLILSYEEIHVAKSIQKCVTIMTERAEKGEITVNMNIPKHLPPLVVDRIRFVQVILNILSNSVKFTNPGGKVDISISTNEVSGAITDFVVTIEDTGIGMSEEDINKAFQSFGQVDSGLNRKYEGTGLGLPLTKKLMELHNGSIDIQSVLGEGTKVVLTFPAIALESVIPADEE